MRKFLATLCLAGLGITSFLLSSAAGQKKEDGLLALVRKVVASWETMDFAKIEPYYADDADLAYFDLAPLKYDNWAAYRAGAQKGLFDPNSSIKIKINDDLWVHVPSANFAWATFTFGADITSKQGATTHLDARWTMILEKRAKGWIVVHEHVSAPLGGS